MEGIIIEQKQISLQEIEKCGFPIVINGDDAKDKQSFLIAMEKEFKFPDSCANNLDAFLDYMRDLSWIDNDIILIIYHKDHLLCSDIDARDLIIEICFHQCILPYWMSSDHKVSPERRKKFTFYLVDEITK